MRHIISLGLVLLLASCAAGTSSYYTQTVDSWRGGNVNALVSRWGTPDLRTPGPNGTTLYAYRVTSYHSYNNRTSPAIGVNYIGGRPVIAVTPSTNNAWNPGAMSIGCVAGFEANQKGVIVSTQIHGNGCYADQAFAAKHANPVGH